MKSFENAVWSESGRLAEGRQQQPIVRRRILSETSYSDFIRHSHVSPAQMLCTKFAPYKRYIQIIFTPKNGAIRQILL